MADAPPTLTAEKLCALTGLSDRRHRQLAKEGYFPPPIESVYQMNPTIIGMFRYYRELGAKRTGKQADLKEEKTQHEILLIKARLDREHRKVIPTETVNRLLLHISTRLKTMLYQFMETEAPPKLDGLSAAQQRPILREMADKMCQTASDLINDFEEP